MNPDTYTCAHCGRTFEKEIPDEEAQAEAKALWGDVPAEEQVTICDDCFRAFMPWAAQRGLVDPSGTAAPPHDGLPVYVVYDNPADFPGRHVVRRQRVTAGGAVVADEQPIGVADTLDAARLLLPPGLARIERHPEDEPQIVECWL